MIPLQCLSSPTAAGVWLLRDNRDGNVSDDADGCLRLHVSPPFLMSFPPPPPRAPLFRRRPDTTTIHRRPAQSARPGCACCSVAPPTPPLPGPTSQRRSSQPSPPSCLLPLFPRDCCQKLLSHHLSITAHLPPPHCSCSTCNSPRCPPLAAQRRSFTGQLSIRVPFPLGGGVSPQTHCAHALALASWHSPAQRARYPSAPVSSQRMQKLFSTW